jgi:hypothetical protein
VWRTLRWESHSGETLVLFKFNFARRGLVTGVEQALRCRCAPGFLAAFDRAGLFGLWKDEHSLDVTELVNDAYLILRDRRVNPNWEN